MLWISKKDLSTAHLSVLEVDVGRTILKPSDTSFNRVKKKSVTLKEELILIKGKNNKKHLKNTSMVFISDLAKAVLTVLPAAKCAVVFYAKRGSHSLAVCFSSLLSFAFIQLLL